MAYSEKEITKIVDRVCGKIQEGSSLRAAMSKEDTKLDTFYRWIDKDPSKREQYARAMTLRNELKFESIEKDYLEEPQRDPETGRIDTGWVQLQRLKIDAKKWELSKLQPKKYGDRLEVDQKTTVTQQVDLSKLTDDELRELDAFRSKIGIGTSKSD